MIELNAADFHKARSLFEPLMASQMFCAGVLDGLYAGRVWVDDPQQPQSGFISKDGMWWFLAGNPDNHAFNRALNAALFNRTVTGEKGWGGMLVCHPKTWDAQMPVIFMPHIPNTTERLHYTCRTLHTDWRAHVPDGFQVRFVDETLLEDGVAVHGAAEDVLKARQTAAEPDLKAVGYVAVHDGRIVASSVIDCIVNGGGDIGLFTDPEFRRRNLAYLTSAAVIEYALAHGVDVVHWDCQSFNAGSIRTAEKLGLKLDHTHNMHTLILNPLRHELNRVWAFLDSGQYERAAEVCQQAIVAGGDSVHPEYCYMLARCQLAWGQLEAAAEVLTLAVKSGWDSVEEMQADFTALAAHPSWAGLVAQAEKNTSAG